MTSTAKKKTSKPQGSSVTQDSVYLNAGNAKPPSDRVFGCLVGSIFLVLGFYPALFSQPYRPSWLGAGAALAILGLVFPKSLALPKRIWLAITHRIGIVATILLTGSVFFLVLTPVAIVLRAMGRDPLRLKRQPNAKSYWISSARDTGMQRPF